MNMAQVTAATVKELRERTGAGMMDCKKALAETDGDMEGAVDWLRAKGLAAAAKKSGRVAAEGLIGVAVNGARGAMVEVNSETDFVAKNEQFQSFVSGVAALALEGAGTVENLLAANWPEGGTVQEKLTHNSRHDRREPIGRRSAVLQVGEGVVVPYVHTAAAPGLGKIGVLVALESAADQGGAAGIWASSSRCTSPRPTRWRCAATSSTPR
jgi:elongation factor Ts